MLNSEKKVRCSQQLSVQAKISMNTDHLCGELMLNDAEGYIKFNCGCCGLEYQKLDAFLEHVLTKHFILSERSLDSVIKELVAHTLSEKYTVLTDCDVLENGNIKTRTPEDDDRTPLKIESINLQDDDSIFTDLFGINGIEETDGDAQNDDNRNANSPNDLNNVDGASNSECSLKDDMQSDFEDLKAEDVRPEILEGKRVKRKYRTKACVVEGVQIEGTGPYTCPECGKTLVRRATFITHIRSHKGIKPYICDICGVKFADLGNLNVHRQRHLSIKRHVCEICEKRFTSTTELKLHMRGHTGERPYKCEMCDGTFCSASKLGLHRRRQHTKEKPHLCEICNKRFFLRKDLHDHLLMHSGERPYECPTCSAGFSLRNSLKQHMQLHLEIKKYKCDICKKPFAQRAGVFSHMKSCRVKHYK